jgi:hypothetical protein
MAIKSTGRIIGLRIDRTQTLITLDADTSQGPKDGWWHLSHADTNYNALFSLALAAASNRWPITIRVSGDGQISPDKEGHFKYLSVHWAALDLDDD